MNICSPGSACILSLRGTEPDPGPVTKATTGTNHVCGPVAWQGQNRARLGAAVDCARAQAWWTRALKGSGLGSEARGYTALKGAHDRDAALVVAAVQRLGSARQRTRQWAQAAV